MEKNISKSSYSPTAVVDLLLQIERYNDRIRMLQSYQEPDLEQSIMNAKELRSQFLNQLSDLLSTFHLEVKLRAQAA